MGCRTRFAFPSVGAGPGATTEPVFISDARNFIAPTFAPDLWDRPRAPVSVVDPYEQLAAAQTRTRAAAAAADGLLARYATTPEDIDRRLRPLERQLQRITEVLTGLERAASAAEEADAAADAPAPASGPAADEFAVGGAAVHEVQIAKNDAVLQYDTNLPTDFLAMVYVARGATGSAGVIFGTWYRALQDRLIVERPLATRTIDYRGGRMSRTFMGAALMALQACGRLYVGSRPHTAFEAAVLCLHLVHRALVRGRPQYPATFMGLIGQLPQYLDTLAQEIDRTRGHTAFAYAYARLPPRQFQPPNGGRYERGALEGHVIVEVLSRLGILPPLPGVLPGPLSAAGAEAAAVLVSAVKTDGGHAEARAPGTGVSGSAEDTAAGLPEAEPENYPRDAQAAYVDEVNRAAGAYLARAQNLFLTEDQALLRAAVNTISALLLLRRLLWNGNVYGDRLQNTFQLGALLPGAVGEGAALPRGADGPEASYGLKSGHNNFSFLCTHYVTKLYMARPDVEVTQLFPGLVVLALNADAIRAPDPGRQHVVRVAADGQQGALVQLIALELENRQRAVGASIADVVRAHDAVLLQFERGVGLLLQQARLQALLTETRRLRQFHVTSAYDLLYFLCLGYIPLFTSAE